MHVVRFSLQEVQVYRGCLGMLYSYDWISIPLVYTQVTLQVWTVHRRARTHPGKRRAFGCGEGSARAHAWHSTTLLPVFAGVVIESFWLPGDDAGRLHLLPGQYLRAAVPRPD